MTMADTSVFIIAQTVNGTASVGLYEVTSPQAPFYGHAAPTVSGGRGVGCCGIAVLCASRPWESLSVSL